MGRKSCESRFLKAVMRDSNDQIYTQSNGAEKTADSSLESRLENSKNEGVPLEKETLTQMEGAFGHDFTNVRIPYE